MTGPRPQKESELPDFLVLALSTCFVHSLSILVLCKDVSMEKKITIIKDTGLLKHFMICTVALNCYGFCFLKTIKSIFKIFVSYILRLCAWHKKWYLISPCWVTRVIRELLGTEYAMLEAWNPVAQSTVNKPRPLFT